MTNAARSSCIVASLALLVATAAPALTFSVTGGWSLTVGLSDLTGQAGSDLASEYTSAANAVVADVGGALLDTEPWTVTIHRTDVSWGGSLTLSMKRTSDGLGSGSISGGTSFQVVTLTAQTLFLGTGNRSSIQLQLKLAGMSVTIGSKILSTEVTITLLDT